MDRRAKLAMATRGKGMTGMLTIHDFANATFQPWPGSDHLPEGTSWIDAKSPSEEEIAFLKRSLRVDLPTLEQMSEIEHSSRFYRQGEAICITVPLPKREADGGAKQHPMALMLTQRALVTVRFEQLKPCEPEYLDAIGVDRTAPSPLGAMVAVLESIVDHLADELELLTARLDGYSRTIFAPADKTPRSGLRGDMLRGVLGDIGRQRQFHSLVEETLLILARAMPFLRSQLGDRLPAEISPRLDRIGRDVESLSLHETRLSDKIQFLLDASLGLISVEQNDIFKVLTIVSVIGIPPTLVASMYGMNFKNIPEYDWAWGYQWGLFLIVLGAVVPLLWFRWRRWW
jgi:magnesium transporter